MTDDEYIDFIDRIFHIPDMAPLSELKDQFNALNDADKTRVFLHMVARNDFLDQREIEKAIPGNLAWKSNWAVYRFALGYFKDKLKENPDYYPGKAAREARIICVAKNRWMTGHYPRIPSVESIKVKLMEYLHNPTPD